MFEPSQLLVFAGATLALLLVPGPAVLYIVGRSVSQGRMAGLISALGVATAGLCHVVAAALGLSAVLLSSALAFNVVKYLGAAYLIYLGLKTLLARTAPHQQEAQPPASLRRIYSQGVIVNLLNPKTALFFFAFLPQFVDVARGNPTVQILTLGTLFVGMAVVTDSAYALLASAVARRWHTARHFQAGQRYFTGLVYVGLGVGTALSGSNNK